MFAPPKFQLFSFWVILSIAVHVTCYNDSRIWFTYGNSSIEYINDPAIDEAALTAAELPGTVISSLENVGDVPGPVPELVAGSADDHIPDERDSATILEAIGLAAPIQSQELPIPPFDLTGLGNELFSWGHYQESNSPVREFGADSEIPTYGEDVPEQLTVPGGERASSLADEELYPPDTLPAEIPGDQTPSNEEVDGSLQPASAQSTEEGTSKEESSAGSPGAPQIQQHISIEERWITHLRRTSRSRPGANLSPRRRRAVEEWLVNTSDDDDDDNDDPPPKKRAGTGDGIVDSNNVRASLGTSDDENDLLKRKFWTLDEDNPNPKRSRLWGQLGTAAAAAASLALLSEAERRTKRERSAVDPMKCKKINPLTGKPCNTLFSRPYDLTRHEELIHTRRRPKVHCPLCGEDKTFTRNDALTRHLRVVHPEYTLPTRRKRGQAVYINSVAEGRHHNNNHRPSLKLMPTPEAPHQGQNITRQPDTQPISQEELTVEVEGIYAGLLGIEAESIEADKQQAILALEHSRTQSQLNDEQWQSLIALHTKLLYSYNDFFLANQQPSASRELRRWARKYSMPLHVRRHGIINLLELLRQQLPASQEHMATFITLSYSMMNSLYAAVPAFQATWINCLADIARYRALVEDDIGLQEECMALANYWSSKAAAKSRELRGLPAPNLTRCPDNVHGTIARFLDHRDLVELSLSCTKLRTAYQPFLAERLKLKKERRYAELQDQWTTRATLALPLGEDEVLETMGSREVKTSFNLADSVPSAILEPQETIDDCLHLFLDLDVESTDEESNKSGPLYPPDDFHGTIPTKELLVPALLHSRNDLTVMKLGEEDRSSEQDDQECDSGDEMMNIDEEEETADHIQSKHIPKFGSAVDGRSAFTQDDEKNSFDFSTPSMTDGSTTIKYSPHSKFSPSTPCLLTSPNSGSYHCPQCTYSCRRMCDLRKHSKYHIKEFHCSLPTCKRSFSRKQDLVRHGRGPHQNGSEEHYCPHAKCRAKNKKPFPRKDNLMKHLRNVHGLIESKGDEQVEDGEHIEEEEQRVENEPKEEDKGEQNYPPGSDIP